MATMGCEHTDPLEKVCNGNVVKERRREPMTILFSDIVGSTAYFEQKGDVEGLRMLERHQALLLPCIEANEGRVVKTIGDAIMALFRSPQAAVEAAVGMQRALGQDNENRDDSDQVHVRIGMHSGLGLAQDGDVFGDVVNAAARVQGEAEPDQILITEALLFAAEDLGYQVGKLPRARIRGKDEPIELYVLGWSPPATQRLIDALQAQSDRRLEELHQAKIAIEDAFDSSRREWNEERRTLNREIERLEEEVQSCSETAREQIDRELRQQFEFRVDAAERARMQLEEMLSKVKERFEVERSGYQDQIASLENRLVEAMERVNNPARIASEIRERVQERLVEARLEWESEWSTERRKLLEELDAQKRAPSPGKISEARRLMLERVKARQKPRGLAEPRAELERRRDELETECARLRVRLERIQQERARREEVIRSQVYGELHHSYETRIEQIEIRHSQMEERERHLSEELAAEREAASVRVKQLEEAITQAEEAARAQALREARSEQGEELIEAKRIAARSERRHRETAEQWNFERERLEKQIDQLRASLEEARATAFRRPSDPSTEELDRLRRELEDEFRVRTSSWEDERQNLILEIQRLKDSLREA